MRFYGNLPGAYEVTEEMTGVHPIHTDYPLLPGDLLTRAGNGTWQKHTGLGIFGFVLTDEQEATLRQLDKLVPLAIMGLDEYAGVLAEEKP